MSSYFLLSTKYSLPAWWMIHIPWSHLVDTIERIPSVYYNKQSEGSASASSSGSKTIVLKAMGRAINKAVTIAEILKRKMPLHQWNVLSSLEMIDLYEPIEEGLDVVENRRYVSCLTITLSLTLLQHSEGMAKTDDDSPPLDTHHFGYQPPLPLAELQQSNLVSYSNYSNIPQPQRHQQ